MEEVGNVRLPIFQELAEPIGEEVVIIFELGNVRLFSNCSAFLMKVAIDLSVPQCRLCALERIDER